MPEKESRQALNFAEIQHVWMSFVLSTSLASMETQGQPREGAEGSEPRVKHSIIVLTMTTFLFQLGVNASFESWYFSNFVHIVFPYGRSCRVGDILVK